MTGCIEVCHCEAESQDPAMSPGPVHDGEILCRGGYNPLHGPAPRIKDSFIRKLDLAAGQLSVYRWSEFARFDLAQVVNQLTRCPPRGRETNSLGAVFCASAGALRSIRSPDNEGRAVCIRDECVSDATGGKHPAHAHVALCSVEFPPETDLNSEEFKQVWSEVLRLFRAWQAWP